MIWPDKDKQQCCFFKVEVICVVRKQKKEEKKDKHQSPHLHEYEK